MPDEDYDPKMKTGTKRKVLKGFAGSHVLDCPLTDAEHDVYLPRCRECMAHNYFDGEYVYCDDEKSKELVLSQQD